MSAAAQPFAAPIRVAHHDVPTPPLIAELADLEAACFAEPWGPDSLGSTLDQAGCAVATVRPLEVVPGALPLYGYCLTRSCADELEILQIATHPSVQQQGLGQRLLDAVLSDASRAGMRTIFLEVRRSNQAARRLYERAGFTECGLRRRYYPAPAPGSEREDALLLRRERGPQGATP
jgi:ribosomal-protein-alanine N-acetyltransferase